jgi:dTDP-4-dehydrorhamnose 3,5-epimerase
VNDVNLGEIEGVRLTKSISASDSRGIFTKVQPSQDFQNGLDSVANSINPRQGTIRGLHFQIEPFAEEKIITCVQGAIFDVVVDIRPQSKTFGKWACFELSIENQIQAYLPKGIAHGFQTLKPNAIVQYCLSAPYSVESAFSIDPLGDLSIFWPIKEFFMSERDAYGISFTSAAQKYAESLKV